MLQTVRNIVFCCLQAFAFSLCLLSAQAQFDYTTNNGAITITSYTGPGGSVTIPDTINGLPVTDIGVPGRFGNYQPVFDGIYITNVTIPDSVTSIWEFAFAYSALTSVTIPDSVTTIGRAAFADCGDLTTVRVGKGVTTIGASAFAGTLLPTGVYFSGNARTYIDPHAFVTIAYGQTNPCDVTVYYLPGTSGWGPTLAGRPAVCWNPRITSVPRIIHGGSGTPGTRCEFTITGSSNMVVAVEACANLANPAWFPVSTVTLTSDQFLFGNWICQNWEWTNYPARFYRLRWP